MDKLFLVVFSLLLMTDAKARTPATEPDTVGCQLSFLARSGKDGVKTIEPDQSCVVVPIVKREFCEPGFRASCEKVDYAEIEMKNGSIRTTFVLYDKQVTLTTESSGIIGTTRTSATPLDEPEGVRLYAYFERYPIQYKDERVVGTALSCSSKWLTPKCSDSDPTVQR